MTPHVPRTSEIADLLESWLATRLDPAALTWLRDRLQMVAQGDRKTLFLSFGLTSRKTGKADLALTAAELGTARALRPGWSPERWSIDQAARTLLVLRYPSDDVASYVATLDQLFAAGEVHELVALYQALPLYPHPEAFQLRCAEGQRTHMQAVFTAIAHHNPYPAEQLGDDPWNQLVLKALFLGLPLDPILGLDDRANPKLVQMLRDFAAERKAAGRTVSEDLWRCVREFD